MCDVGGDANWQRVLHVCLTTLLTLGAFIPRILYEVSLIFPETVLKRVYAGRCTR